jgi:hypothetical protein
MASCPSSCGQGHCRDGGKTGLEEPAHAVSNRSYLKTYHPVRLNLSSRLISHGTMFFSHNKTASAGLSAAETIQRTWCIVTVNMNELGEAINDMPQ